MKKIKVTMEAEYEVPDKWEIEEGGLLLLDDGQSLEPDILWMERDRLTGNSTDASEETEERVERCRQFFTWGIDPLK